MRLDVEAARARLRPAGKVVARARSWTGFVLYRGRERAGLFLGLVALVAGLLTPLPQAVSVALGAALGVAGLLLEAAAHRRAKERLDVRPRPLGPLLDDALPDDAVVVTTVQGHAAVWPAVDAALLAGGDAGVQWQPRRYTLPPRLGEVAYHGLLEAFRGGAQPRYNGPVVQQRTDLTPALLGGQGQVLLRPATYFDLLCSNYSVEKDVRSESGQLLLEGRSLVLDGAGRLRDLRDGQLADAVGVSTLAFGTDGLLVLVEQGVDAASSGGLVAPSGSGSLEPRDVRLGARLADTVVAGMERELGEELNLPRDARLTTAVTGWFRWWEKGAKPEYVGLTVLDLPAEDVGLRRRRWSERAFVRRVLVLERDAVDLALLRVDPEAAGAGLVQHLRARGREPSVPLLLAVRALGSALRTGLPVVQELGRRAGVEVGPLRTVSGGRSPRRRRPSTPDPS